MNTQPEPADVAAMREDGDLLAYLISLTGRTPRPRKVVEQPKPQEPDYVIPHKGAWPIGAAASGPTPTHGKCTCPACARKGTQ